MVKTGFPRAFQPCRPPPKLLGDSLHHTPPWRIPPPAALPTPCCRTRALHLTRKFNFGARPRVLKREEDFHILNHHERGNFHPHRSGRRPNGKCLLVGVALLFFVVILFHFILISYLQLVCTYFAYEACPLRELYCLEHGIHPDGSIPAEYQVAS